MNVLAKLRNLSPAAKVGVALVALVVVAVATWVVLRWGLAGLGGVAGALLAALFGVGRRGPAGAGGSGELAHTAVELAERQREQAARDAETTRRDAESAARDALARRVADAEGRAVVDAGRLSDADVLARLTSPRRRAGD
jgi:apolipoprotein N-acyltransferase